MRSDAMRGKMLSSRIIPNASPILIEKLKGPKELRSLGIFTSDSDDVSYVALDEATKKADVKVIYAKSMYAGAGNASTALAGEFVGIIAGNNPEDVKMGLKSIKEFLEFGECFKSANDQDSIVYFSSCVSRTGSYLSGKAKVKEGTAMAYLIAAPLESIYALDFALKAADVTLKVFYGPPTETNFGGALLIGDQAACKAACEAFEVAVLEVAENPC